MKIFYFETNGASVSFLSEEDAIEALYYQQSFYGCIALVATLVNNYY